MRKSIKNYTSKVPVSRIIGNIQTMLAEKGAKQVSFEYDQGEVIGVMFIIPTSRGDMPVKLPARVKKVVQVMYGTQDVYEDQYKQAMRTAWKNIHDWMDAQLALLETEMVKLEEIFLPYMTTQNGQTFYEIIENRGFLLGDGHEHTTS